MNEYADNDPRLYAIPDIHGHAKGEHKAFTDERPIPLSARMLFLWFFHACRRGWPRFLMVTDHMNYLTFEDPAAINLVRRALKLAQAGDLYGAAETASVEVGHAAVVSEGLRRGMRYSIGAEVDNDPRSRPDAQNIVDAMKPDGMIRSVHFLTIDHPTFGPNWNWPFDNPEFSGVYDLVGTAKTWELYMTTLLDAVERLPGNILGHFYVPAGFGHWPDDAVLETYEDQIVDACEARGMAIEFNTRFLYRNHTDAEKAAYLAAHRRLLTKCKAKNVGIAIGSDAHSPKDQGRAFDEILPLLDECEINELVFPIAGRLARVALRVERKAEPPAVQSGPAAPLDDRKAVRKPRTSEAPARPKDSSSKREETAGNDDAAPADDSAPKAKPRPKRSKNRTAAATDELGETQNADTVAADTGGAMADSADRADAAGRDDADALLNAAQAAAAAAAAGEGNEPPAESGTPADGASMTAVPSSEAAATISGGPDDSALSEPSVLAAEAETAEAAEPATKAPAGDFAALPTAPDVAPIGGAAEIEADFSPDTVVEHQRIRPQTIVGQTEAGGAPTEAVDVQRATESGQAGSSASVAASANIGTAATSDTGETTATNGSPATGGEASNDSSTVGESFAPASNTRDTGGEPAQAAASQPSFSASISNESTTTAPGSSAIASGRDESSAETAGSNGRIEKGRLRREPLAVNTSEPARIETAEADFTSPAASETADPQAQAGAGAPPETLESPESENLRRAPLGVTGTQSATPANDSQEGEPAVSASRTEPKAEHAVSEPPFAQVPPPAQMTPPASGSPGAMLGEPEDARPAHPETVLGDVTPIQTEQVKTSAAEPAAPDIGSPDGARPKARSRKRRPAREAAGTSSPKASSGATEADSVTDGSEPRAATDGPETRAATDGLETRAATDEPDVVDEAQETIFVREPISGEATSAIVTGAQFEPIVQSATSSESRAGDRDDAVTQKDDGTATTVVPDDSDFADGTGTLTSASDRETVSAESAASRPRVRKARPKPGAPKTKAGPARPKAAGAKAPAAKAKAGAKKPARSGGGSSATKTAPKKNAAKKVVAKKAPAKKAPAKKAAVKKTAAKKAVVRTAPKKAGAKKVGAKKAGVKKSAPKRR